jgi:homocysteine S-methyltransferase
VAPLVAASVGPYGAYLADGSEYAGRYGVSDTELREFHAARFRLLAGSGPDLLACETIPSASEAAVLLSILDETPPAWGWFSFSCADARTLWDGTPIERVARLCRSHERVAGVGVNCTDPRYAGELVRRLRSETDLPIVLYPNSGERYDAVSKRWGERGEGPAAVTWLEGVRAGWAEGARVVGGCCRVGPDDIAELRTRLRRGDWLA